MSLAVGYTEAAPAVTISRVDDPLFPQLHHGNRGEGLGDRRDPKDRVLGSRGLRPDVGDAVSGEPLQRSVADHAYRQTNGGPAVEDLGDLELHPRPIDSCSILDSVGAARITVAWKLPVAGGIGATNDRIPPRRTGTVTATCRLAAMCLAFQLSGATATYSRRPTVL